MLVAIILAALAASPVRAEAPCAKREVIFGKIIAVCGARNVVYVGVESTTALGVRATISHFEVTYCEGGGRLPLAVITHSEGVSMRSIEPSVLRYDDRTGKPALTEDISIDHAWGQFMMTRTRSDGSRETEACSMYNDPNTNPRYAF